MKTLRYVVTGLLVLVVFAAVPAPTLDFDTEVAVGQLWFHADTGRTVVVTSAGSVIRGTVIRAPSRREACRGVMMHAHDFVERWEYVGMWDGRSSCRGLRD